MSHALLQKHCLKKTKLRLALLNCFIKAKHAQSYAAIKKSLGVEIDKSTLYRNLSVFEQAGIIHRINDQSGVAKYAFGKAHGHDGNHAHFVCENCQMVYCMEDAMTTQISVPKGFKKKAVQTIVKGICSDC